MSDVHSSRTSPSALILKLYCCSGWKMGGDSWAAARAAARARSNPMGPRRMRGVILIPFRRSEMPRVVVVIPAVDEEEAIGPVVGEIPRVADEIIVVDNGSRDRTAARAEAAGARVVHEPRRGYGQACLAGIAAAPDADVFVFLDGDHSDYPEQLP